MTDILDECDACEQEATWLLFVRLIPPVVLTVRSCSDHLLPFLEEAKSTGRHDFMLISMEKAREVGSENPSSYAPRN